MSYQPVTSYNGPRFQNADEKICEPQKMVPDYVFCLTKPIPIYAIAKTVYCYKHRCYFSGTKKEVGDHILNFHKCTCLCTLCGKMFKTNSICRRHMLTCMKH